VWAERVPVSNVYRDKNGFETLQEWECDELGIPPVPDGVRSAAQYLTDERLRSKYDGLPKDSFEYHVTKGKEEAKAVKQWLPLITTAMELPATELFLKLRRGEVEAMGKRLPEGSEIIDFLGDQNSYSRGKFENLVDSILPRDLWTMPGIDWISNAVSAHGSCYCDVSVPVEVLMRIFPGVRRIAAGAEFVGNCLLVKEHEEENTGSLPRKALGRPPRFAWEAFHIEVADLIKSGRMPGKKEAAIQHILSWFASTEGGEVPSRSAVSEKLTPYYRRFFFGSN